MNQRLAGILLVVVIAAVSFGLVVRLSYSNPYLRICDLVSGHIYLSDEKVAAWDHECRQRSTLAGPFTNAELVASDARKLFSQLQVSHLELYNASAVRGIWRGQPKETGLEARFVDGIMVVVSVQKGSAADLAGIKVGDEIVSLAGENPSEGSVRTDGGKFVVKRGDKAWELEISPDIFMKDDAPNVTFINNAAVLKIPTMRGDDFEQANWMKIVDQLQGSRRIIVDLRGNPGGNFVAGLRVLSSFICEPQEVAALIKPKGATRRQGDFVDDLDNERQLDVIDRVDRVGLRTFKNYGCLKPKKIVVLIDGGTASTAELVAQVLREQKGAHVLGAHSAGQLLVGIWYSLPELGPGWQLSIPEATAETKGGMNLESNGLSVDKVIYDDLAQIRSGKDSWVEAALKDLGRDF